MEKLRQHISIRFVLNVAILLLLQVFVAGELFIGSTSEHYFKPFYSLDILTRRPVWLIAAIVLALLIWNFLPHKQNRWLHQWSWSSFEHGNGLRVVIMVVVIVMTWAFAFYNYNYYFNQAHLLDRLLLVVLAVMVYVNPIFIIPFTVICYNASFQMLFPVPYAYTDKQMLFEFMALFGVFVAIRPFTRGRTLDFIFVGLCLISAYYYFPGIEKLHISAGSSLNWVTDNDLHHYIVFSFEKDWLSFRNQDFVYAITDIVEFLQVPFQLFTIIMEIGIIFILLFRRRFAMGILTLAILLHTGIMFSAGVFFWKWIALDAVMIWFLWRYGDSEAIRSIFKPVPGILSVVIIASGVLFFDVLHLGWWNSPIHDYYTFEVIDTEGDSYQLEYSQLQPYDFAITQNRLHYANDNPTFSAINGAVGDPEVYWESRFLTLEDVPAFVDKHSVNRYRKGRAENLYELLRVYAYNINTNYQGTFLPALIQPPMHINSQSTSEAYNYEHPIQEVRIHWVQSFYDGDVIHILKDEVIKTIPITIPDELLENS